jgi:hypothetical protein
VLFFDSKANALSDLALCSTIAQVFFPIMPPFKESKIMLISARKRAFSAGLFLLLLSGCALAPQALKPIVTQNQQNLNDLGQNIQVLLGLYEPLLQASSKALIYQHISSTRKDLIGVVGASTFGPVEDDWDTLFANTRLKEYNDRYQYVRSALTRGITEVEKEQLRRREGWIYSAAAHPDMFTPQVAQDLIKTLADLQKSSPDLTQFFSKAEEKLLPYDGTLALYRQAVNGAEQLFDGLRQELFSQLATAATLSQAISHYAETEISPSEISAAGLASSQMNEILNQIGEKYIKDEPTRQAAIDLFTHGVGSLLK